VEVLGYSSPKLNEVVRHYQKPSHRRSVEDRGRRVPQPAGCQRGDQCVSEGVWEKPREWSRTASGTF